ncbi:DUF881 domain-containing protein [Ornithinimicrobium cerasi]|uniref:DUF881 domain-containing protein n=1 Tax=Ornithinimicrobium cerasi TaxID=2248773 RepID=UPI000EFEDC0B|nr:DUF881 domain-containing protein [Ornithinimicrobium cerasi]
MSDAPSDRTGRGTAVSSPAGRARARTAGVTAVCALAGLLFGTSAALARAAPTPSGASDLVTLITARDQQVRELNEEAEELRTQVGDLQAQVENGEARRASLRADRIAPTVGLAPVAGPAVQVTLDDAGYTLDTLPDGYSPDDVVVHQQDLQAVVNALWAGGAEAMMVQDQRIVATSSVQCVGNTLYLQGRVYSPPYTITAVGDPELLQAALTADPEVANYRAWADAIGLGYAVQDIPRVEMPGFTGGVRPRFATAVDTPVPSEDPTPGG